MEPRPRVSVVIPAYESHRTLEGCLRALEAQTFPDFEVILIDSSPSNQCEQIVRERFPRVNYEHVPRRMLPHEARNHGAQRSGAEILVFTDPDVYAEPEWLARLLAAYAEHADVIIGSVLCYGSGWLDTGVHLAKFDLFLPGGKARPISIAPTLNMLCPRSLYLALGGIPGEWMIGDTVFSWQLLAKGHQITFAPEAVVHHHHTSTWLDLLRERYTRGREFGRLRALRFEWSRGRVLTHLLLTLLPIRWLNLMRRTLVSSVTAGMLGQFIATLPITMSGQAAWLLGEARGFLAAL